MCIVLGCRCFLRVHVSSSLAQRYVCPLPLPVWSGVRCVRSANRSCPLDHMGTELFSTLQLLRHHLIVQ